jgi:hypothetical protein
MDYLKKKFILNAIMRGWRVHKKNKNCYVFKKNKHKVYNFHSPLFLKIFLRQNLIK